MNQDLLEVNASAPLAPIYKIFWPLFISESSSVKIRNACAARWVGTEAVMSLSIAHSCAEFEISRIRV